MRTIPQHAPAAGLLIVLLNAATLLLGQVPEETPVAPPSASRDDRPPAPTVAEVEAALAALESDASIEEPVKAALRQKYQQALEALKSAASFTEKAHEYREAIQAGPEKTAALRDELKALGAVENAAKVDTSGSTLGLQNELDSRRVSLELLREQLADVASESVRTEGRPVEIPARLLEVRHELSEIRQQLASRELAESEESKSRTAETLLLRAGEARLANELEALEAEQLSQSIRQEMLKAQQALLERQIAGAEAAAGRLSERLNARLSSTVERVRLAADAVPDEVVRQSPQAKTVVVEVRALADQLETAIREAKQVEQVQDGLRLGREALAADFTSVREQLELGSEGQAMVQLLYDLDRQCLEVRRELREIPVPALEQPRAAAIKLRDKLREQPAFEQQLLAKSAGTLTDVLAARKETLEELDRQYASLARAVAATEDERQQYLDQADEVREYIAEMLFGFGLRACPAFDLDALRALPEALRWEFRAAHWKELGSGLSDIAARMPFPTLGAALLITSLLLLRPRIVGALKQTGLRSRRISTDRYRNIVEALLWTFLLAIPIPMLIGYSGWALGQLPKPSDWLLGLQAGLQYGAWIVLAASVALSVMHRRGLGTLHFGWRKETLDPLRRVVCRTVSVYVPALLVTLSCSYGGASQYLESLGRVSFILAHLWMAFQAFGLFFSRPQILSAANAEEHPGLLLRWRWGWIALLIVAPVALVGLTLVGYMITPIMLSLGLITTLSLIGTGVILHGLAWRWFVMKQRKLALEEALELRRARRESDEEAGASELVDVDPEDALELDLGEVAGQTRDLLRAMFTLGVLIAVLAYWSGAFPVIDVVGSVQVPFLGGLTLLRLAIATLIVVVTYVVVRNLPGVLELAVLRSTDAMPGTRHAIYTLCQYGATAVGAGLFLNVVQIDWAKFGWVVAALSVGIGFGLQEVVANFVCGLILLFERPIRVGDIVTVESTTGTVTKIHLRATTITNWDRQEFVVPNRTLITNTLLNWTLSAPLNRVVIPVGVAYGSNTNQAREILLAVAADHPNVLKDPQPMATFEQFADSTLNLVLRVYLPDLDARLATISELHTAIHERFADAGIEIAFPQRDLHLRSGWKDRDEREDTA